MKASLNASVRDAQIRDSFNKESCVLSNDKTLFNVCMELFSLQTELPRNASKLHSLVVYGDDSIYLLNFEVLRSIPYKVEDSPVWGFSAPKSKKKSKESEVVEND